MKTECSFSNKRRGDALNHMTRGHPACSAKSEQGGGILMLPKGGEGYG
jgi:hypothetical protein